MFFKISKIRWALSFACLCMFVLGIADNIRGPLFAELLKFFSLSNTQGSLSFAFASCAAFCGTVSSAWVLKKIHLDKLLLVSMFLMMLGLFQMGMAPQFGWYIVGAIIFGFSLGTTAVAQNLLIAENVAPRLQTQALSGLHGLYGLSSLIAPYLASRSPDWFSGDWRSSFFVTGVLAGVVFLLVFITRPDVQFHHLPVTAVPTEKDEGHLTVKMWFAGFFATYVAAEILVSTRLALYMRTYYNMNLEESSNYVIYFFVFLLVGRLVFTVKKFQMPLKSQLNLFLSFSLVALLLGLIVHPFFLTLVGFAMAPFYPQVIVYISELTGPKKRSYLTFVMAVQGLCVILMHVGVGYITDTFGLFYAFGMGIILLLVAIFCLNFHPKVVF